MAFLSKWRNIPHLVGLLLIALTLSCGGGGGGGHAPEGSLQVFNNGTSTMTQLFVTPSTSSSWGLEQLTHDLAPGDSITLTGLYPGYYDVLADFLDHTSDKVFDVSVQDGVTTPLDMFNSGNGAVAVYNNSGLTINEIYLTRTVANTWGPNQLPSTDPLLTGHPLILTDISPGTYDLRVYFTNGGFLDSPSFGVYSGVTTPLTVNYSGVTTPITVN